LHKQNQIIHMKKIHFLFLALLIVAAACTSTSNIIASWKDEAYKGPKDYKKIAVVALAYNESNKLTFEQVFVKRLNYLGYGAMYGSKILVPSVVKNENKDMLEKMMKENGVDAVMIMSLLQVKDGVRYVPGSGAYTPGAYYGGYYGYYSYNYNHYYGTPGYYESTTSMYLECNFYDVNDGGKLISSIQTETVDPSNIEDLADSFSYTILTQLINQGILKNKSKEKKK